MGMGGYVILCHLIYLRGRRFLDLVSECNSDWVRILNTWKIFSQFYFLETFCVYSFQNSREGALG